MRENHLNDKRNNRRYHRIVLVNILSILSLVQAGGAPHHPHNPHHCPEYGGCRHFPFLPAPPGSTPDCAKSGSTFCESIDHYPSHLIQYLVDRWSYDYSTLLSDESREDFKPKKETPTTPRPPPPPPPPHHGYGPPYHPNFNYGPPRHSPPLPFYPPPPPPTPVYNSINFSQPQEGYPDRRYPLFPQTYFPDDDPGFIYSALLQPELAQINHNSWWKRYTRSQGSSADDKLRNRRQANGQTNGTTTQLCPTRSQFVMPKAALNNKGNWMYVVNLDQDRYTQLVRSETCMSEQCNGLCSLPNGYTSRCEQQYVQKRLVALEGGGNRLYTDVFWFPHCCICQITQTGAGNNNG
ncbi:protein spaetzle 5-like [Lycorma delicatula]|uniref:protein spaetzle 5-like n=1 Tax=Lycorma delicatula TaxID=130591 RepID=UPI003F518689